METVEKFPWVRKILFPAFQKAFFVAVLYNLPLPLYFYARGFKRERNTKEKVLPSFSQLVQPKIPKAGVRINPGK